MASLFPTVSNALDRVMPGMDNKQVAAKMEEQSSSLKSITKILVKNNDELRKDVTDLKKEFILGTSEFSRMRQYFERMDNAKPAEKVKEREGNSTTSGGILQKLLSSLTRRGSPNEPKEIELKTLEEIRILKTISLKTSQDMEFIKTNFEERTKKKDRELLANAIASAMDIDTDNKKGFLAGILGAIAGAGTLIVSNLGKIFSLGFSGITSLIRGLPDTLKLISKVFSPIAGLLAGLTTLLAGLRPLFGAIGAALMRLPFPIAKLIGGALLGSSLLPAEAGQEMPDAEKPAETRIEKPTRDKSKEGFFEGLWKDTEDWIAKGRREDEERKIQARKKELLENPPPPTTDVGEVPGVTAFPGDTPKLKQAADEVVDTTDEILGSVKNQFDQLKEKLMGDSGLFELDNVIKDAVNSPLGKFALDKIKGLGELEFEGGQKVNIFSGLPSVVSQLYNKGMQESQELRDAIEATFKENPPVSVNSSTVVTGGTNQQIAFSDATPMSQSDSFRAWLRNNGVLRGGD